jgi:hypothetical protein
LLSPFLLLYGSSAKLPKLITTVATMTTANMKSTRKRRPTLKRRKLRPKTTPRPKETTNLPRTIPRMIPRTRTLRRRTRILRRRTSLMTPAVRTSLRTRTRHRRPMTNRSTSLRARTHRSRLTKTLGKDLERPRRVNESRPRRRAKRMYDLPCDPRLLYRVVYCVF